METTLEAELKSELNLPWIVGAEYLSEPRGAELAVGQIEVRMVE